MACSRFAVMNLHFTARAISCWFSFCVSIIKDWRFILSTVISQKSGIPAFVQRIYSEAHHQIITPFIDHSHGICPPKSMVRIMGIPMAAVVAGPGPRNSTGKHAGNDRMLRFNLYFRSSVRKLTKLKLDMKFFHQFHSNKFIFTQLF